MKKLFLISCISLLVACSKKKDKDDVFTPQDAIGRWDLVQTTTIESHDGRVFRKTDEFPTQTDFIVFADFSRIFIVSKLMNDGKYNYTFASDNLSIKIGIQKFEIKELTKTRVAFSSKGNVEGNDVESIFTFQKTSGDTTEPPGLPTPVEFLRL